MVKRVMSCYLLVVDDTTLSSLQAFQREQGETIGIELSIHHLFLYLVVSVISSFHQIGTDNYTICIYLGASVLCTLPYLN